MRSGLTLLELMMVLVILAIVSTVAIQSLQPQVENQRFQAATKLVAEIESATVGPRQKYQVDGTPREVAQRQRGRYLEVREAARRAIAPRRVGVHLLDDRADDCHKIDQFGCRTGYAVDGDALLQSVQMRRSVNACPVTGRDADRR